MTLSKHLSEEKDKLCKLEREKPYVYAKMQKYNEMYHSGKPIAIVRIEYDFKCNFRCAHCCIRDFQLVKDRRVLTPGDVGDIFSQADSMGLARCVITGGEPLIFRDLDDVVAAVGPERFYINIDTNGWYLNHEKAKHLKSIGVDRIQLSIDSLNPMEHDEFRRKPGSHWRCIQALEASQAAGLDIFVQTVVTKSRLYSGEFIQFLKYFNGRGVSVFVTYGKPVGAWKDKKDDLISIEDIRWFERELEPKYNCFTHMTPQYGRPGRCIAVWGMVSINQFGDVHPCLYWYRPIGNVFNEPLKDILERGMGTPPYNSFIDTCPVADVAWQDKL